MSSTLPPPEEPAPKGGGDEKASTWVSEYGTPEWTLPLHEMPQLPKDYEPPAGTNIMPIVVFHNQLYLPLSQPPLTIMESRYQSMYEMILSSKISDPKVARRFVAVLIDDDSRLLTTGLLMQVVDVKMVGADSPKGKENPPVQKFAARHLVIGRMRLANVLNPEEAKSRDTFMWAEVEEIVDEEIGEMPEEQEEISKLMLQVAIAQEDLDDTPRFLPAVRQSLEKNALHFGPGVGSWHDAPAQMWKLPDMGLWGCIQLWQRLLDERSHAMSVEMHGENQKIIAEYYETHPKLKKPEGHLYLEDLPEDLQTLINVVRMRYKENASPFDPTGGPFQLMVQTQDHKLRLQIFAHALREEVGRLQARTQLKALCKDLGEPGGGERRQLHVAPAAWLAAEPPHHAAAETFGGVSFAEWVAEATPQRRWESEWRRRMDCWVGGLALPSQARIHGCVGALGLHIASRLDAAWRGAAHMIGAPTADAATAAAQQDCEWLGDAMPMLELPAFPEFPKSHEFTLPPIPSLLPKWQTLQSHARTEPTPNPQHTPLARTSAIETPIETPALTLAIGGIASGFAGGIAAAAIGFVCLRSMRRLARAQPAAALTAHPARVSVMSA